MLQIQIGAQRPAGADDVLCRAVLGWRPGMTQDQIWTVSRGVWRFSPFRVLAQDEVQIVNLEGTVVAVAAIIGVAGHGERFAIDGRLLRDDPRVGRPTPWPHRSRNPVNYVA
ncbi:hypothetical protein [Streptomyces sp. NPDC090036]|uniref:hypothetical protein n=1 Tax=Streptomyces sp. NPDC090036 TaxID=3365926 RepID=UPI0038266A31